MSYQVYNTETGETVGPVFETIEGAHAEMMRRFPVVTPWDGVEVPIAIIEVTASTPPTVRFERHTAHWFSVRCSRCEWWWASNAEIDVESAGQIHASRGC